MTEAEWLVSTNPMPMLAFVKGKVSKRKLRLFGCACCRRTWNLLNDPRSRIALEIIERYSDGLATEDELAQAVEMADQVCTETTKAANNCGENGGGVYRAEPLWDAAEATEAIRSVAKIFIEAGVMAARNCLVPRHLQISHWGHTTQPTPPDQTSFREDEQQIMLLRDVCGFLPFRAVHVDPAWFVFNDATVVKLAQLIYDERRFEDLPILRDALLDAGCHDQTILEHCHEPIHVRGCWLVDALLGKE